MYLVIRLHTAQDFEDLEEKVEDVEVKHDRSPDVLIIRVALDQCLSVINNKARENYSPCCTRYCQHCRPKREEQLHGKQNYMSEARTRDFKFGPGLFRFELYMVIKLVQYTVQVGSVQNSDTGARV